MTESQKALYKLLTPPESPLANLEQSLFIKQIRILISPMSAEDLASLFVDVSFVASSMQFLSEEYWLQYKNTNLSETEFKKFISEIFKSELSPIPYLQAPIASNSLRGTKLIHEKSLLVEKEILSLVKGKIFTEQKAFMSWALQCMAPLFSFENNLQLIKKSQGLHLGLSLYRAFDGLDEIFNLNYNADHDMKTDLKNTERLYEGAGVGVQSSYATVLAAIHNINPTHGARFIDLGSGYGRVGLVIGLMRPDIDFTGYEFVEHRVDIANSSSQNLGLKKHVHFITQDLSLKAFQIPEADIYYMYDPFSEETYSHVLSQLVTIARHRKIIIATKGNARGWLMRIAQNENWPSPQEFDGGNLCLFYS